MFAMLLVYFLIAHICNGDMDILVIGDWGGAEMTPYTTPEELATANVMNRISSSLKPSMIWALGDNFYLKGVEDINDHRFQDVWANVFNGSAIESIPFYVVAGNHDHYGNVSAEIAYSNVSSRWIFPDYWYTKTWTVPDTTYTLQLLMIDTILLCGNTMNEEYCKYEGIADKDCILSPMGPQDTVIADQQWEWIQKELNSSIASYLIIGGHYPVWSIAEHGPTSCLVNQLRPMLIENNVTLLMTGHDHTFEYIQEDEFPGLGYVDTGGAHECNPSTKHEKDIPIGSLKFHDCNDGGFTRVHIDKDGLFVDYYFGNDTNVYFKTQTFKPRM